MTISPAILDAMLAAGCTAEQIVAAVKADAQEQDARAARKRERKQERAMREGKGSHHLNSLDHDGGATNIPGFGCIGP